MEQCPHCDSKLQLGSLEDIVNLDMETELFEEICPVTFWSSQVLTLPGAEKRKKKKKKKSKSQALPIQEEPRRKGALAEETLNIKISMMD